MVSLQKDIADPTLFLKTYLEVSMGTGSDFDALRKIFADLSVALISAESAVSQVKTELEETKQFIQGEIESLRVNTLGRGISAQKIEKDRIPELSEQLSEQLSDQPTD